MEASTVIQHYHRQDLYQKILHSLQQLGIEPENVTTSDLQAVDQFHVGGGESTLNLLQKFPLSPENLVLDVGCGIGGPCRMIANEFRCPVQGIDLTPGFVDAAIKLSQLVGLDHLTNFMVADALQLPFDDHQFDVVWTQHTQMNIADKQSFYGEINRVLKPGGKFIFHDLFQGTLGEMRYPVPWSEDGSHSFLISFDELDTMFTGWGFNRVYHSRKNEFALEFFRKSINLLEQSGKPPLGAQLVMGDSAPQKLKNMLYNFSNGYLELHEAVYEKI